MPYKTKPLARRGQKAGYLMARRVSWRIPLNINVRFHCCDKECSGTVINLSENGMSISTNEICFPKDLPFEIMISFKEQALYASVKLVRSVKTNNDYDSIGVEILNPSQEYLSFVKNLMYVL